MEIYTTVALVSTLDTCERGLEARDALASKLGVGPQDIVPILTILDELGLADALFCMGAPGKACKAKADEVLGAMMLEILDALSLHRLVPANLRAGTAAMVGKASRCIDRRARGIRRDAVAEGIRVELRAVMDDTETPATRAWIELHWTLLDPTITLSSALVRAVACLADLAALHGRQRRTIHGLTGRLRAHLTESA